MGSVTVETAPSRHANRGAQSCEVVPAHMSYCADVMRAVPLLLLLLSACAQGTADDTTGDEPDARVVTDPPDANEPFIDATPAPDAADVPPDAMETTGGNADTCAMAVNLTSGATAAGGITVTGDTTGFANDAEPASTCTNGFGEDGPDAIYYVNATAGQTLSATVTGTGFDSAIYITQMCAAVPVCVVGADAIAGTGPETVSTTIATTGQYFVFVDSYIPGEDGPFSLQVTLQ